MKLIDLIGGEINCFNEDDLAHHSKDVDEEGADYEMDCSDDLKVEDYKDGTALSCNEIDWPLIEENPILLPQFLLNFYCKVLYLLFR